MNQLINLTVEQIIDFEIKYLEIMKRLAIENPKEYSYRLSQIAISRVSDMPNIPWAHDIFCHRALGQNKWGWSIRCENCILTHFYEGYPFTCFCSEFIPRICNQETGFLDIEEIDEYIWMLKLIKGE